MASNSTYYITTKMLPELWEIVLHQVKHGESNLLPLWLTCRGVCQWWKMCVERHPILSPSVYERLLVSYCRWKWKDSSHMKLMAKHHKSRFKLNVDTFQTAVVLSKDVDFVNWICSRFKEVTFILASPSLHHIINCFEDESYFIDLIDTLFPLYLAIKTDWSYVDLLVVCYRKFSSDTLCVLEQKTQLFFNLPSYNQYLPVKTLIDADKFDHVKKLCDLYGFSIFEHKLPSFVKSCNYSAELVEWILEQTQGWTDTQRFTLLVDVMNVNITQRSRNSQELVNRFLDNGVKPSLIQKFYLQCIAKRLEYSQLWMYQQFKCVQHVKRKKVRAALRESLKSQRITFSSLSTVVELHQLGRDDIVGNKKSLLPLCAQYKQNSAFQWFYYRLRMENLSDIPPPVQRKINYYSWARAFISSQTLT